MPDERLIVSVEGASVKISPFVHWVGSEYDAQCDDSSELGAGLGLPSGLPYLTESRRAGHVGQRVRVTIELVEKT